MKQKDEIKGQVMPWAVISDMLTLREQTKSSRKLPEKQRQVIEEMAENETAEIVQEFLYGL